MVGKIIFQGAEALILLDKNKIIKKRVKKSYRISELDEKIRKLRTRAETKLLEKASKKISVPKVLKSDEKTKEILMEFINGKKLSKYLDNFPEKQQLKIFKQVGENIAKLHDSDIIHGDLTTSNMIVKNDNVYFIDFGLGFISYKIEDKAVDLHLLKQALEAKHFKNWEKLFSEVLKNYKKSEKADLVLKQLEKVEKRGRYK
jgi:Kae1-associated kinase Bud32|tara:strand:- start:506 stop:1111 length:606 start_codon:yes stop_codon:yes gene_type:complete